MESAQAVCGRERAGLVPGPAGGAGGGPPPPLPYQHHPALAQRHPRLVNQPKFGLVCLHIAAFTEEREQGALPGPAYCMDHKTKKYNGDGGRETTHQSAAHNNCFEDDKSI